jgi:GTP cyclohydrolase II
METLKSRLEDRLQTAMASAASFEKNPLANPTPMTLKQIADVRFPTRWAEFRLLGFEALSVNLENSQKSRESALALILGDIHSSSPIVRIHSQCITGEAFHSLRCDCHDQLHLALRVIADEGAGVLIYEQQEGRGIGLMEKLRAYALQDEGLDTVEANLRLGHAVDSRDYQLAVQVLHFLKIHSLRLISNNPEKLRAVRGSGIRVVERIAADVPANMHSMTYLNTKRKKLGHFSPTAKEVSAGTGQPCRGTPMGSAGDEAGLSVTDIIADFRGASW